MHPEYTTHYGSVLFSGRDLGVYSDKRNDLSGVSISTVCWVDSPLAALTRPAHVFGPAT